MRKNTTHGKEALAIILYPIANEEKSRNLHEDDDDTFMKYQEKMNLEKSFIKINQGNNIKKENNSKSKYCISIRYFPR